MNGQEELLTGGGRGDGRWESCETVSSRRWKASCNFTHTWSWRHRFWFLARFHSIYPLEKTIQWCLGDISGFSHHLLYSLIQPFATPWTAACQASLSFTISHSLFKFKSVMPSNHLILCHPLLPPAFNLSQHQVLCKWVSCSHQVAQVLELQFQHQSFQWIVRTHFLWLVWSPCIPRDSQESSPTPQFKSINSLALSLCMVHTSHSYMTTGETIALTRWTFVGKVVSAS